MLVSLTLFVCITDFSYGGGGGGLVWEPGGYFLASIEIGGGESYWWQGSIIPSRIRRFMHYCLEKNMSMDSRIVQY
jgi:hypothetical protein